MKNQPPDRPLASRVDGAISDRLGRRELLRRSLLLGVAGGVAPLLAACGGDDDAATATTAPTPDDGSTPDEDSADAAPDVVATDTIRAAFAGAGASETLDPYFAFTALDFVRARAMHASLGNLDPSAPEGVAYGVLEGIDAADDLSSYTLRVRPGLEFNDGSPLGAVDVLYSLRLAAAEATGSYALFVADFDLDAATTPDELTVVLPTRQPIADGRELLCIGTNFVLPDGTEEFTADMATSGPFTLVEFDPGVGSRLVRNERYGGIARGGGPFVAELELRSIPDEAARLNALQSGQVDFAHDLSPLQVRTAADDDRIRLEETEPPYLSALYFQMNMAVPPFDDPRVRQAFRVACDRQQILDTVLFGRGVIGNDLFSLGFADYAASIPQLEHDPDEARRLLVEAGAEGVEVTLRTGPESPGMIETATVYIEQLRSVGVDARLDEAPPGQLFADFEAYVSAPLVGGYSTAVPAMLYYQVVFLGGGPFAFGWNRPDVDEMVTAARSEPDAGRRLELATDAQQILWDEGNTIIPVFKPVVSARDPRLVGIEEGLFTQYPSFAEARFE